MSEQKETTLPKKRRSRKVKENRKTENPREYNRLYLKANPDKRQRYQAAYYRKVIAKMDEEDLQLQYRKNLQHLQEIIQAVTEEDKEEVQEEITENVTENIRIRG